MSRPKIIIRNKSCKAEEIIPIPGPLIGARITVTDWLPLKTALAILKKRKRMRFVIDHGEVVQSGKVFLETVTGEGEFIFVTDGKVKSVYTPVKLT
jgi:hypothetical protein